MCILFNNVMCLFSFYIYICLISLLYLRGHILKLIVFLIIEKNYFTVKIFFFWIKKYFCKEKHFDMFLK